MKKNQYYCISKDNVVIYISTSKKACDKEFNKLDGEGYNVTQIDTLGILQNL